MNSGKQCIPRLGEIATFEYGAGLPAHARSGGSVPVLGSSGTVGTHNTALVSGPGIVVGRKGTVGAVTWCEHDFWPIDTAYYVVTKQVEMRWFFWLLQSLPLNRLDSSTGVPGLNRADAYRLRIVVPSLLEQRLIAKILDTVDEAIRKTEAIIAKLGQVKQGLLHDLLTRGIDENGQLRDPDRHPEQFKDSPLGRIPREWEMMSLGDVVPRAVYGISEALNSGPGIPILRMMNLKNGEADLSDLKYSTSRDARNLLLQPGDVLFNRTNSIDHVGRTGIWRGQLAEASFASYLVRLEPDPERLNGEFLNRWLNWDVTQMRIRRFATPGVHQVNINPTNLRKTPIAVPGDVREQRIIASAMDALDERITGDAATLTKLTLLKRGLMDDLLTGRVRVTKLLQEAAT